MFNSNLFGMTIIESLNCVELTGKQLSREEKRTWKERLFTLPWHPWKSIKTVYYPEAIPAIYRIGNQIVGHPAIIAELKAEIDHIRAEPPVERGA